MSESTIKREIKRLEELGYISRETKNVKGGRERHMTVNQNKINEELTKRKMSLVNTDKAQNEPCTSVKMSFDKGQIDTIKDNINKIIEKDNNSGDISPLQGESITL
jgi:DNA-binding PadR family transcriptional regulator